MTTITSSKYGTVNSLINGKKVQENGFETKEVFSPTTGELLATLNYTTKENLDAAVESAQKAFELWSKTNVKERAQVFYKYWSLLNQHKAELTELVHLENGKTLSEAQAEVEKSIELTEFACSIPQLIGGETLEVSNGVSCTTVHEPVGVVACITPFNFPNMVPHWTVPNALMTGNAVILKPSEEVPLSAYKMAELLQEAGLPAGLFNIVNGGKEMVEAICDHPGIKALSFVGSTPVAKIVYSRASMNLKRALALGGAKNHLVVLPDADPTMTANNVVASMAGCAGQRCMAASVMVAVGDVDHIIEQMVEEANKLTCGVNLGAVIHEKAKARIESYITQAEANGAKILVDGRNTTVEGKEGGTYVGPTIIDYANIGDPIVTEEVFGPVIAIIRVKTIEEAIAIENSSAFGNAASIFTQSGKAAAMFTGTASAGMVGVNVGVPVPREPFAFAGWNDSKFGVGDITGKSSLNFWTQTKKITTKWQAGAKVNWMS